LLSEEQAINEVNHIMTLVDIDRNGQIDYTEFILATMDKKKSIEKEKI
jgi:calcium-dependent protein kinase